MSHHQFREIAQRAKSAFAEQAKINARLQSENVELRKRLDAIEAAEAVATATFAEGEIAAGVEDHLHDAILAHLRDMKGRGYRFSAEKVRRLYVGAYDAAIAADNRGHIFAEDGSGAVDLKKTIGAVNVVLAQFFADAEKDFPAHAAGKLSDAALTGNEALDKFADDPRKFRIAQEAAADFGEVQAAGGLGGLTFAEYVENTVAAKSGFFGIAG